jgi:protein SCO1/2
MLAAVCLTVSRFAQGMGKVAAAGLFLGLAATAASADAGSARLDPKMALAKSEAAIGRTLGAYTLTDSAGARFSLSDYRGKPLIVSLIYTSCSSVCPPTTQRVIDGVRDAGRLIGLDRFAVLTIGFDARNDTPARLSAFAATQGVKADNWRLASGDAGTIEALLRDLGFSYATISGGFDHVTQTTIVDGDGKVYRHVYGDDFPVQMLIEPLKDVVLGRASSFSLGGLVDRIKFICTTYDPAAGRYKFDYGLIFGSVIAAMSLIVFAGILFREWRRFRNARATNTHLRI